MTLLMRLLASQWILISDYFKHWLVITTTSFFKLSEYNVHKLIVVHLLFTVTCERKFTILHESIRLILRQKSSSFLQESSCAECSSRGKRVSHVRLKSAWDSLVDSLRTFIVVQSNAQT